MTAARGEFEYDRLDRLRRLSGSLRAWHSVGVGESEKELESLKRLTRSWKMPANLAASAVTRGEAVIGLAAVTLPGGATAGASHGMSEDWGGSGPTTPNSPAISYDSSGELEVLQVLEGLPHLPDILGASILDDVLIICRCRHIKTRHGP